MTHRFYTLWAPIYDWFAGPLFVDFRRRAIAALELSSGQRLLISGVGTGLDFPFLPPGIEMIGSDLNASMLARAQERAQSLGLPVRLERGNAETLPYPDASFDCAYLPCIVCVASDGGKVLREALRVVKPGGKVIVIDKFLAENRRAGLLRIILGYFTAALVTNINRRWSDVSAKVSGYTLLREEAGPLGGFFRLYVLRKN